MADLKNRNFLTYAYILLYITLSSGQIFFNKVTVYHFKLSHSLLRLFPSELRENALSHRYRGNGFVLIFKARIRCSVCVFLFWFWFCFFYLFYSGLWIVVLHEFAGAVVDWNWICWGVICQLWLAVVVEHFVQL